MGQTNHNTLYRFWNRENGDRFYAESENGKRAEPGPWGHTPGTGAVGDSGSGLWPGGKHLGGHCETFQAPWGPWGYGGETGGAVKPVFHPYGSGVKAWRGKPAAPGRVYGKTETAVLFRGTGKDGFLYYLCAGGRKQLFSLSDRERVFGGGDWFGG